jgi:hypothetical protein
MRRRNHGCAETDAGEEGCGVISKEREEELRKILPNVLATASSAPYYASRQLAEKRAMELFLEMLDTIKALREENEKQRAMLRRCAEVLEDACYNNQCSCAPCPRCRISLADCATLAAEIEEMLG